MFCLFNPLLKTSRGEDLKNLYSPCTIMFLLLKLLKKTITSPVLLLHFLNCLSCSRCSPKRPVSVFFSILLLLNYFFFPFLQTSNMFLKSWCMKVNIIMYLPSWTFSWLGKLGRKGDKETALKGKGFFYIFIVNTLIHLRSHQHQIQEIHFSLTFSICHYYFWLTYNNLVSLTQN